MELTVDLVRTWLSENADDDAVKSFLADIARPQELTADSVGEWLKGDDGQRLIQPIVDRRVTDAVKTHDAKTRETVEGEVKRRVAEEMLRLNPQETPEQKRIRELEEKDRKRDADWARDKLKRSVVEEAGRMQVDAFFVDDYLPGSLEEAKVYLQKIKERDKSMETRIRNELLASGYKPGSGNGGGQQKKDLSKLSMEEAIQLEMEGKLDAAL